MSTDAATGASAADSSLPPMLLCYKNISARLFFALVLENRLKLCLLDTSDPTLSCNFPLDDFRQRQGRTRVQALKSKDIQNG